MHYCMSKKSWPIYEVRYYMKWVRTSWTKDKYSIILVCFSKDTIRPQMRYIHSCLGIHTVCPRSLGQIYIKEILLTYYTYIISIGLKVSLMFRLYAGWRVCGGHGEVRRTLYLGSDLNLCIFNPNRIGVKYSLVILGGGDRLSHVPVLP